MARIEVIKRDGSKELLNLEKLHKMTFEACEGLSGVSASQIETVSFGREKPAVQGNDETAHAKNRRVELFYK